MSSPSLPPADWYDDPDTPGWRRFWDGAAWTSDRHPVVAPPPPPTASVVEAAPAAVSGNARTALTCPVCGRSDMLQNIGVVLDAGTSTTQGTARTTTTGSSQIGGMASDLTLYSGSATTSATSTTRSSSVTRSQLAQRFTPPRRPRSRFARWFVLLWLGSVVLLALILGPQFAPASRSYPAVVGTMIGMFSVFIVLFFVMWIPALIVALIVRAVGAPALARRRSQWDQATWRLRSAYFCARDGVAVEDGRTYAPEAFRAAVYGG